MLPLPVPTADKPFEYDKASNVLFTIFHASPVLSDSKDMKPEKSPTPRSLLAMMVVEPWLRVLCSFDQAEVTQVAAGDQIYPVRTNSSFRYHPEYSGMCKYPSCERIVNKDSYDRIASSFDST